MEVGAERNSRPSSKTMESFLDSRRDAGQVDRVLQLLRSAVIRTSRLRTLGSLYGCDGRPLLSARATTQSAASASTVQPSLSTDDLKARGEASPDDGDTLAMTFAVKAAP